ncbi:hypothetical protein SB379_00795 [Burkholderia multivorans]|uniref:hypothetical protein n=1 Tax=Burkholderia multivorans TaxID=87883 RepID=UPI002B23F7A9|nr:hypothetical protein [Burkholderia multivorans]MEB2508931.1 hypothetical protein [Burkholderia multivorans]MEB2520022.1 hypothetical protein [Burkholderia multivorans]MEB2572507.1 hypothetical protein [Burkholderia multivorans]MEB2590357.1 hypothetical protein [Burkholderia multivorans]
MDTRDKSLLLLDAFDVELGVRAGKLFKTIEIYGGQFDAEEVGSVSFVAPAAFSTFLGWRKLPKSGQYIGGRHAWYARLAVFVVTKHASRVERMRAAILRAEVVSRVLSEWDRPACFGRPENVVAENMYSRKFDAKSLAVWMVSWWQEVEFDGLLNPDELPDLVGVDVHTTPTTRPPDPTPAPASIPNVQIEIEGVTNGPSQDPADG